MGSTLLLFSDSAAAAAVSPIPTTSLALWLRADALALSNTNPVATWTDSSGNGNTATAVGAARPTYRTNIRSYPVVRFDGVENWMRVEDTALLEMDTNSSVFFVCYPTVLAGGCYLSKDTDAASAGAYLYYMPDDGLDHRLDRPFSEGGSNSGVPQALNTPSLLEVVVNGTTVQHFTNGTQAGSNQTLSTGTQTNQPLRIGAFGNSGAGFFIPADIAEIIIYNAALSVANRQTVESYLMTKYGL